MFKTLQGAPIALWKVWVSIRSRFCQLNMRHIPFLGRLQFPEAQSVVAINDDRVFLTV